VIVKNHSKQDKYEAMRHIVAWLERRRVACDMKMRKSALMELVEPNRPKDKVYSTGQFLKRHGHEVVLLLPYMCECNLIEWPSAKVKRAFFKGHAADATDAPQP
jgi:hypothetical protein